MGEKFLFRFLIVLLILILLAGGGFVFYIIREDKKMNTIDYNAEQNNIISNETTEDCSEMNGWWDTGYHEFTITAPVVKSWNGNEGIIEKDPSGENLYKITFEAEKDGYIEYLIYYIKKAEPGNETEYIFQDTQQGSGWFDLYKRNDN